MGALYIGGRRAYRNSQVIATGKLGDFANVPEASAHDNGLVSILLVVIEDGDDTLNPGILLRGEILLLRGLVPIQDSAYEWGDEESAGFSGSDSLWEREHKGQIAINAMLRLQFLSSLDALPG